VAELGFYRYVDNVEARIIQEVRRLAPTPGRDCKWYSPNRFESAEEALRYLALAYLPTFRVGPIPERELPEFDYAPLRVVSPAWGQPGGGIEAATTQVFYLFDIAPLH